MVVVAHRPFFFATAFWMDIMGFNFMIASTFYANKVLNATSLQMGLLGTVLAASYALGSFTSGRLTHLVKPRTASITSVFGLLLCALFMSTCARLWVLYLLAGGFMFSYGNLWPPVMAWMTVTTTPDRLSRTFGGYNICWTLGSAIGFFIAGPLFEHISPSFPFLLSAGMIVIFLIAWSVFYPKQETQPTGGYRPPAREDCIPFLKLAWITNFCAMAFSNLALSLFPKIALESDVMIGETGQAILHATRMLAMLSAFLLMLRTSHWHYRLYPLVFSFVAFIGFLISVSFSHNYFSFFASFYLLGIGIGISYYTSAYYSLQLFEIKGKGSSIHEGLIGAGGATGGLYGGMVAKFADSNRAPFASAALLSLLPLIFIAYHVRLLSSRKKRSRKK